MTIDEARKEELEYRARCADQAMWEAEKSAMSKESEERRAQHNPSRFVESVRSDEIKELVRVIAGLTQEIAKMADKFDEVRKALTDSQTLAADVGALITAVAALTAALQNVQLPPDVAALAQTVDSAVTAADTSAKAATASATGAIPVVPAAP